jgi:hypothetical protein
MRWPERSIDMARRHRPVLAAAAAVPVALLGAFLVALLAACTTTSLVPPAPAGTPAAPPAANEPRAEPRAEPSKTSLIDELQRLRSLPGPELAAETQKLLESADARLRLKGAIALALPQHPARDEARAVALAEDVARAETAPALRDLAAAVALWLEEQRRAEAAGRRAQTKAREDEARLALAETRLRDMERRAQEAEKKLEALRAIERELSGRGGGNGRP